MTIYGDPKAQDPSSRSCDRREAPNPTRTGGESRTEGPLRNALLPEERIKGNEEQGKRGNIQKMGASKREIAGVNRRRACLGLNGLNP